MNDVLDKVKAFSVGGVDFITKPFQVEDVRAIAQMQLEMATDWNVLCASSGEEGLAIAQTNQPDVILLDMMMPDMDGRATLQQLKANPATKHIPVILVTAKAQSSQDSLSELDVAAVFAKPFRPLKLAEQIDFVIFGNSG